MVWLCYDTKYKAKASQNLFHKDAVFWPTKDCKELHFVILNYIGISQELNFIDVFNKVEHNKVLYHLMLRRPSLQSFFKYWQIQKIHHIDQKAFWFINGPHAYWWENGILLLLYPAIYSTW